MPPPIDELIPTLPADAPFTPEQRAYLNGFLAGLFSRAPLPHARSAQTSPTPSLVPLTILFGSQTGNAENLAKRAAKEAGKRGFAPTVHDLAVYSTTQLASDQRLLVITSTYGDGEPPDNAKAFWNLLGAPEAPQLHTVQFSVCALGDSNYPAFCAFGKNLDQRLEALGARRLHARIDCDVDFEEPFAIWLNDALNACHSSESNGSRRREEADFNLSFPLSSSEGKAVVSPRVTPQYSKSNPFPAPLLTNKKLNGSGSSKDTRHFEFSLRDSNLTYEAGDALGVLPTNCPDLVNDLLTALKFSGDELVAARDGANTPLRSALFHDYEITRIPHAFLAVIAERSGDALLKKIASPQANGELTAFLRGREIIDLLLAYPSVSFAPAEFAGLLKKLQPRLYSISSSPKAHPGQVHLTVNVVRYESLSRHRKGVCSTFLADRVRPGLPVRIFVHSNKNFRPPADPAAPMIMVGPGTGVAPFRAFLQERRATGATGRNWLFFGDQHSATDFMYRDELESMLQNGLLTRLDTAFSRDQSEKIYVQHRLRENAGELFAWLEAGAHFYVCGDASRMAKDVDSALHEILHTAGRLSLDGASEYLTRLKAQKRYQRDVY
jgi:sulfite reductase (NADPH) flavoprotein alpha-component